MSLSRSMLAFSSSSNSAFSVPPSGSLSNSYSATSLAAPSTSSTSSAVSSIDSDAAATVASSAEFSSAVVPATSVVSHGPLAPPPHPLVSPSLSRLLNGSISLHPYLVSLFHLLSERQLLVHRCLRRAKFYGHSHCFHLLLPSQLLSTAVYSSFSAFHGRNAPFYFPSASYEENDRESYENFVVVAGGSSGGSVAERIAGIPDQLQLRLVVHYYGRTSNELRRQRQQTEGRKAEKQRKGKEYLQSVLWLVSKKFEVLMKVRKKIEKNRKRMEELMKRRRQESREEKEQQLEKQQKPQKGQQEIQNKSKIAERESRRQQRREWRDRMRAAMASSVSHHTNEDILTEDDSDAFFAESDSDDDANDEKRRHEEAVAAVAAAGIRERAISRDELESLWVPNSSMAFGLPPPALSSGSSSVSSSAAASAVNSARYGAEGIYWASFVEQRTATLHSDGEEEDDDDEEDDDEIYEQGTRKRKSQEILGSPLASSADNDQPTSFPSSLVVSAAVSPQPPDTAEMARAIAAVTLNTSEKVDGGAADSVSAVVDAAHGNVTFNATVAASASPSTVTALSMSSNSSMATMSAPLLQPITPESTPSPRSPSPKRRK